MWSHQIAKKQSDTDILQLYCVDLEVWSELAKCVHIMRIASKCVRGFDCDWQRVNAFSHCVTLILVLLSQIISYSDTKVPVLVVMECKHANVICVFELIFYSILQGQQSIVTNDKRLIYSKKKKTPVLYQIREESG